MRLDIPLSTAIERSTRYSPFSNALLERKAEHFLIGRAASRTDRVNSSRIWSNHMETDDSLPDRLDSPGVRIPGARQIFRGEEWDELTRRAVGMHDGTRDDEPKRQAGPKSLGILGPAGAGATPHAATAVAGASAASEEPRSLQGAGPLAVAATAAAERTMADGGSTQTKGVSFKKQLLSDSRLHKSSGLLPRALRAPRRPILRVADTDLRRSPSAPALPSSPPSLSKQMSAPGTLRRGASDSGSAAAAAAAAAAAGPAVSRLRSTAPKQDHWFGGGAGEMVAPGAVDPAGEAAASSGGGGAGAHAVAVTTKSGGGAASGDDPEAWPAGDERARRGDTAGSDGSGGARRELSFQDAANVPHNATLRRKGGKGVDGHGSHGSLGSLGLHSGSLRRLAINVASLDEVEDELRSARLFGQPPSLPAVANSISCCAGGAPGGGALGTGGCGTDSGGTGGTGTSSPLWSARGGAHAVVTPRSPVTRSSSSLRLVLSKLGDAHEAHGMPGSLGGSMPQSHKNSARHLEDELERMQTTIQQRSPSHRP